MNKYNYVVLGSGRDYYRFTYSDLQKVSYAKYIPGCYPDIHSLKGLLYRLHFHPSINRIVNLPFKKCWNLTYFDIDFKDDKTLCFILFSVWISMNIDIINYLRRTYPNCKIVWICQDLISTQKMRYTDKKKYNVDEIKQQCDLVLSFDPKDCETYAFTYYPSVFSSFTGEIIDMPDSDVYLLAKAKNRLKDIYDVYDLLRYHNLKVDLNLVGVDKTKRRFEGEIHYWDGKGMSYIENLQHVLHTKCILEIMQKGGTGYTLRTCEAVCLGKKLLTNNPYVKETPFFRSDYISAFTSSNDMDMDFIRGIKDTCNIDYNYKDKMSPIGLLKFIEDRIS